MLNPKKYIGKRRDNPAITAVTSENQQVKTYMDNSNGVRNTNSNAYNKVCTLCGVYCLLTFEFVRLI